MKDDINHPSHYTSHPSGIECIEITEAFNFNVGNAIKYLWRAGLKTSDPLSDLRKAAWYINREIKRLDEPRQPKQYPTPLPGEPDFNPRTGYCSLHGWLPLESGIPLTVCPKCFALRGEKTPIQQAWDTWGDTINKRVWEEVNELSKRRAKRCKKVR